MTRLSSFVAAKKHDSIAEFRATICSAIALACTVVKTETAKYFTCGRFPTQASDEHLPVRKGRTTYKSHLKIYAHKKFANRSSHTIISCERNKNHLAEIRLFAAKNLPWIVLEVDFGGSRGLLAIRLHFSYNYKLNKTGRPPLRTRGYYIRIGSWWVVIWRHLELAPMLLIDCELWSSVIGPRKLVSRRR